MSSETKKSKCFNTTDALQVQLMKITIDQVFLSNSLKSNKDPKISQHEWRIEK